MSKTNDLSIDEYLVPAADSAAEIKVKGSKFIAAIIPVSTKDDAESIYDQIKKKYYNATHNCFAYRIDNDVFRYSDDGEPSGTAGKPILQAIDGNNLCEILCVVTRYFGGTKLGTGGLIRAYSAAAAEALNKLKLKVKVRTNERCLIFNYENENTVRKIINEFKGNITDINYSDNIKMFVAIPESICHIFEKRLIDSTNSAVSIIKQGN